MGGMTPKTGNSRSATERSIMAGKFPGAGGRSPIRARFGRVCDSFYSSAHYQHHATIERRKRRRRKNVLWRVLCGLLASAHYLANHRFKTEVMVIYLRHLRSRPAVAGRCCPTATSQFQASASARFLSPSLRRSQSLSSARGRSAVARPHRGVTVLSATPGASLRCHETSGRCQRCRRR